MPIVTQPPLIEVSDFSGGWAPDGQSESGDPSELDDVLNLIIDRQSGALQTRKGYKRLREELSGATGGTHVTSAHYVRQLFHFGAGAEDDRLICVVVKLASETNNVQLFAINLADNTAARIDTPGVNWANPSSMHWFQAIDGVLYGGSKGNDGYSWSVADGWNDAALAPATKAWVDATGSGVTTATQYGRDYAWKGNEFVTRSGSTYQPARNIRYDNWDVNETYAVNDRVSRKADGYYRSYKCIKHNEASTTNRPDDGTYWRTYWKRVKLPDPVDEDSNTSEAWYFIPDAAQTSIAMWFGDRLWLRFDGHGDRSRAQFSAPVKPQTGKDIPNTEWDAADWAPGNDKKGEGGGWLPFNDGKHGGAITAMHPFGQYGLVFKRRALWVISGSDSTTWTVRRVGNGMGCVGQAAHTVVDGMVYYLSDQGLWATDGTQAMEVPANNKLQIWLKARLDSMHIREDTDGHQAMLFNYNGFVGIALPDASNTSEPYWTLFYDPETQSFWKTDLPVLYWQAYNAEGSEYHAFVRAPTSTSDTATDLVYIYDHASAGDADDTSADTYASTAITWYIKTGWLPFGTARMQRRIRRIWWLVKGAISMTITQYRNYTTTTAGSIAHTPGVATAAYIEGVWMEDCHAMQLKLGASSAPAVVYGYGVDSQPRRKRYHTN